MRNSTKRLQALKTQIEDIMKTLAELSIEVGQIIEEDSQSENNIILNICYTV